MCLSGRSNRRTVETSNDHDYIKSSILVAVQCNQFYLHLTDNREIKVMVTDVIIGVYFRHKQWFSPSELDMSSPRKMGFDARPSTLEFRLDEEATGEED
jgi:hypothetical protein